MSMDPEEPDRPYSTARRAILDWIRAGATTMHQDVDAREWLDAYAAEVTDQARREGGSTENPYYDGRPEAAVPDQWPTVHLEGLGPPLTLVDAAVALRQRPMHGEDWSRTVPPLATDETCVCSRHHQPVFLELNGHHLWPVFLGGPPHPATLLQLCPNTHTTAHKILRAFLKAGSLLPRTVGQPRYAFMVASAGFQAWDAAGRPKEQPPVGASSDA